MNMRQQEYITPTTNINIHTADPRQELCLTFIPDNHDFSEIQPVTISFGHSQVIYNEHLLFNLKLY